LSGSRFRVEKKQTARIKGNSIDFNKKDRAKPPARRGCSAYASESDTTNHQYSIVNIQFRLVRVGFKGKFWGNTGGGTTRKGSPPALEFPARLRGISLW